MAFKQKSMVVQATTTTGTGQTISLDTSIAGFFDFTTQYSNGDTLPYVIRDGDNFEYGFGTYNTGSPDTLTRDTVTAVQGPTTSGRLDLSGDEARVFVDAQGESILHRDNIDRLYDGDGNRVALLLPQPEQSTNFTATFDSEYPIDVSGGTVTVTLNASPVDGDRVRVRDSQRNAGNNAITVDGNGNAIDGSTSITLGRNGALSEVVWSATDAEWHEVLATDAVVDPSIVEVFTSSGTWNKAGEAKTVCVELIGTGGGGASGAIDDTGSGDARGGPGGGGGAHTIWSFNADDLPSSVSITIGAGGDGAAANTGVGTSGSAGSDGGATSFGSLIELPGGKGGGTTGDISGGIGGGVESRTGPLSSANVIGFQGANSSSADGGNAEHGGGGGGSAPLDAAGGKGGSAIWGGGSGGGGGPYDGDADTNFAGGDGGTSKSYTAGGGGTGGTAGGGDGANGANGTDGFPGQGGGGGGSNSAGGNSGAGGDGGVPGGGGGGAGGVDDDGSGVQTGAGGNGGRGEIRVYTYT